MCTVISLGVISIQLLYDGYEHNIGFLNDPEHFHSLSLWQ